MNEFMVGTITSLLPFATSTGCLTSGRLVVRGIAFAPCHERLELSLDPFLRNRRLNLADPRFQAFPIGFPSGATPLRRREEKKTAAPQVQV